MGRRPGGGPTSNGCSHGELVYTGALRTNLAAVLFHAQIGGEPCPVSSELFAITADAHLLLGNLTPEQCTCSFPDGRGPWGGRRSASHLARLVCAETEELNQGDLEAIATAVTTAQVAVDRRARSFALPRQLPRRAPGEGDRGRRRRVPRPRGGGSDARSRFILRAEPRLDGQGGEVAAAVALSVLGRE